VQPNFWEWNIFGSPPDIFDWQETKKRATRKTTNLIHQTVSTLAMAAPAGNQWL